MAVMEFKVRDLRLSKPTDLGVGGEIDRFCVEWRAG